MDQVDVLFVMPPTDLAASYGNLKDFANAAPSLGFAYMAANLQKNGYKVAILDGYSRQLSVQEVVAEVARQKPRLVGLTVLSTSAQVTEDICVGLRKAAPDILIVGGNTHCQVFYQDILERQVMDVIVFREGEHIMVRLMKALDAGEGLESVAGIAFQRQGQVVECPEDQFLNDLNDLPFPAWDLYDLDSYALDPRGAAKSKIGKPKPLQILGTRGCPMACTFCSSRSERSQGTKYRMRSPENIVDEIEYMVNRYGANMFTFMDLSFPLVYKHAVAMCDDIIKRGLNKKIIWYSECRVKPLHEDIFQKMRDAGCVRVSFGIESMNDETLARIRKGFTANDVRKACAAAHRAGLEIDGMFMLGLPDETQEMALNTAREACKLPVRFAIFNLFTPYPGSELYDELMAAGEIKFARWSDFTSYWTIGNGQPVYVPKGWTPQELISVQAQAMKRFYLRPKFILQELMNFKPSMIKTYLSGLRGLLNMGRQQAQTWPIPQKDTL
ncbi:MAG: radical SAM protein [Alphaproteobacteria bacterium]|nr:radical SAM protein [Alphaproteobacteria bacterium]